MIGATREDFFHSYGLATHHKTTDEQNKSIVTHWNYDTYTFSIVLFGGAARVLKAEREGFEPPEARTSTVFKTAAIDHSATSPVCFPAPSNVAQRYEILSSLQVDQPR